MIFRLAELHVCGMCTPPCGRIFYGDGTISQTFSYIEPALREITQALKEGKILDPEAFFLRELVLSGKFSSEEDVCTQDDIVFSKTKDGQLSSLLH